MRFLQWAYAITLTILLFALSLAKIDETDAIQYLQNGKIIFKMKLRL